MDDSIRTEFLQPIIGKIHNSLMRSLKFRIAILSASCAVR